MDILGFTIYADLDESCQKKALQAQQRVLSYFSHLEHCSLQFGATTVEVWGHPSFSEQLYTLPTGDTLILVGSPHGKIAWSDLLERLEKLDTPAKLELPWEGRLILLKVNVAGDEWTIWSDWLGSIPVFYSRPNAGRIASTLEPVVVAAAGFTSQDIFLPGLITLLVNGHFISDWTLFKEMKVLPPDSVAQWDNRGLRTAALDTVTPGEIRSQAGWEELVDEMYELSKAAVLRAMQSEPTWVLPLSSGLDSRLIAVVGAEAGIAMQAFSWGPPHATDVVYAKQIAKTLGIPWRRIDIGDDYLLKYTRWWADWFGAAMTFHGMYQMAFLDAIRNKAGGKIINGFIGDVLSGDDVNTWSEVHRDPKNFTIDGDNYTCWRSNEIGGLMKLPIQEAIEEIIHEIRRLTEACPGAKYQKLIMLQLWTRQRFFTNFSSTLSDYWRGVATPFMDRDYARFCLSLPRALLDHRRLKGYLFRRHYGPLAVIPGTYAEEPFIRTGRYLMYRRLARAMPRWMRKRVFPGFDGAPLHMDADSVQACGWDALWPIREVWEELKEWLHVEQLEQAYQAVMHSNEDIRPVRKLQAVQTLAYCLLNSGRRGGE